MDTTTQRFVPVKLFQKIVMRCWLNILTYVCISFRRTIELDDPFDVETFDEIRPNLEVTSLIKSIVI